MTNLSKFFCSDKDIAETGVVENLRGAIEGMKNGLGSLGSHIRSLS